MSAITPYLARAVARQAVGTLARRSFVSPLSNPTVRQQLFSLGGNVANFAMRRAANRIKRAWRGRNPRAMRRFKRRRVGNRKKSNVGKRVLRKFADPVGSSNCKRTEYIQEPSTENSRTLYVHSLTTLTKGSANNERERDIINCRGIRLKCYFENMYTNYTSVNVAVISPKDCNTTVPNGTDLFRANDQYRWRNFQGGMSGWARAQQSINTDKYLVHFHKRFVLPARDPANGKYHRYFKRWLKINRQLRFETKPDGNESAPVNGDIYLMTWYESPTAPANPPVVFPAVPTGIINNIVTYAHDCVMYYKETGTY